MIDVLLLQETGGLGIQVSDDGLVSLTKGIQTAVILSLAGGNAADLNISATDKYQFWGNLALPEPSRLRGETLAMLSREAVHSGNISRVQRSAERDLAWLVSSGYVTDLTVSARVSRPRRVEITVATSEGSIAVVMPFAG